LLCKSAFQFMFQSEAYARTAPTRNGKNAGEKFSGTTGRNRVWKRGLVGLHNNLDVAAGFLGMLGHACGCWAAKRSQSHPFQQPEAGATALSETQDVLRRFDRDTRYFCATILGVLILAASILAFLVSKHSLDLRDSIETLGEAISDAATPSDPAFPIKVSRGERGRVPEPANASSDAPDFSRPPEKAPVQSGNDSITTTDSIKTPVATKRMGFGRRQGLRSHLLFLWHQSLVRDNKHLRWGAFLLPNGHSKAAFASDRSYLKRKVEKP
jgi:hypothetical protein